MKTIVIATSNQNKVKEYKEILEPLGYEIKSLKDFDPIEIIEDGTTFEENALIKARALYQHTHHACISDDSGIEIEALNNEPGIYSARYLGEDTPYPEKHRVILERLKNAENRNAKFTCVIALVSDKGEKTFRGELKGEIAKAPKGEHGFGYDPIFYVPSLGKNTAELTAAEKNAISHRGQATRKLLQYLGENKDAA